MLTLSATESARLNRKRRGSRSKGREWDTIDAAAEREGDAIDRIYFYGGGRKSYCPSVEDLFWLFESRRLEDA